MENFSEMLRMLGSAKESKGVWDIFKEELDMPNVPLGTMGGHVWWKDLASYNGMRLQQNHITKHCRLLDKNDRRIAWGSYDAMERAMKRIMNLQKMAAANTESKSQSDMQKMEQLKKLKELLDLGILTETEYAEKKAKILAEI